jgi:hypothetical protein
MLPYTCIDSVTYLHTFKVYYSTQSQDGYGRITRTWTFDRTERGFVKAVTNYAVDDRNSWNQTLKGVSEEDLRINEEGELFAPSEVLVTFIEPAFIETAGPRKGLPTTFELRGSNPVLGPFGEVLHFDIMLVRSADQAVDIEEA